jgi:thiol-disulfide isomerase/thioredoxin
LNTAGPLELSDLRGKFVLLDFWTYCCINCMHILPELEKLEDAYPKNLVVIGVHSAKFETERDSNNITEAILRYHIRHPVINDSDHRVWNAYRVNAWPTLHLIDPEGYAIWGTSGEITFEQIDAVLRQAIPLYRGKGLLDETPLRFDAAARNAEPTPLRFPGKVLADEDSGRLFIADSGHQRIVVARLDGTLVDVIGSGTPGRADGDFAAARFDDPQGMALRGNILYVADNRNHLIRKVDLAARQVSTVAGTGRQYRGRAPVRPGKPLAMALSSPWDLWIHEDYLYIAMAGVHQIWRMKLDESTIGPYAGNGREDIVDGRLLPRQAYALDYASFAQPSGLASDGAWLYVADSEGSSIRAVPFNPLMAVRTIVGTADLPQARLFTFGDVDGPPGRARLQHPLGVVYDEGLLYVADTYNNKIKLVDPKTGLTRGLAGSGKPGRDDQPAELDEPAGITAAGGRLYVADTNNHRIRVVDLKSGNRVTTLAIAGLTPPAAQPAGEDFSDLTAQEQRAPVAVRAENGSLRFQIGLELPAGFKINSLSPMAYIVRAPNGQRVPNLFDKAVLGRRVLVEPPADRFEVVLPVQAERGEGTVSIKLTYYYCREGAEGICRVGSVEWTVPLRVSPDGGESVIRLQHRAR